VLGLATGLAACVVVGNANARPRRLHRAHATESYQPSYASIVVDANSGAVLQATNADSPRHPASLTKIMTLYLLFERLEAGKIKLSTEMTVSAHAAAQAPSKLGLKPGDTIAVETAIRAIVTKSANDVAVIVAEALAGNEEEFAKLMTAKARALGMMHTSYRNASGLPDEQQLTTARDIAILGRAIQDRFPRYYHYFSTRTFAFHGKQMRNHNHLLGNVAGVDGIKTGYIHESGFNIVVNVRRKDRHILAVVFGGRTANARDARVESLIDSNIRTASTKRTAPLLAEGAEDKDGKEKAVTAAAAPATAAPPAAGSTEPIKPNPVKTVSVAPGAVHSATLSALPSASRKLTPAPATAVPAAITTLSTVKRDPPANLALSEPQPAILAGAALVAHGSVPAKPAAHAEEAKPSPAAQVAAAGASVPLAAAAAKAHVGWMIQVGAFDDEHEAKQRLSAAQIRAKIQLGGADPFTEKVEKGDKAMFRARFAGLDKGQAEAACKHLKRSEIPCMVVKN
jgi:D-alanyl-D-alanine carboxypeptidase